jgi:hypothetical protein
VSSRNARRGWCSIRRIIYVHTTAYPFLSIHPFATLVYHIFYYVVFDTCFISMYIVFDICCIWRTLYLTYILFYVYCIWHMFYLMYIVFDIYCIWHMLYLTSVVFDICCIWRTFYLIYIVFDVHCTWHTLYLAYAVFNICFVIQVIQLISSRWFRQISGSVSLQGVGGYAHAGRVHGHADTASLFIRPASDTHTTGEEGIYYTFGSHSIHSCLQLLVLQKNCPYN